MTTKTPNSINPNNTQKTKCKTCPFRTGNERLIKKISSYIFSDSNHICHTDEEKICRGARDLQLNYFCALGILKHPTDTEWEKALKK